MPHPHSPVLVEFRNLIFAYGERRLLDHVLFTGLRGARDLMPSEVSGGMARRVALARAIVLDPELIMYDEPFSGLDPISLGTAAQLIRQLNDTLGIASIAAQGTPDEVRRSTDPLVHQFVNAESEGPVKFHYPGPGVEADFGS